MIELEKKMFSAEGAWFAVKLYNQSIYCCDLKTKGKFNRTQNK